MDDYSISPATTEPPEPGDKFSEGMVTFSFDDGYASIYQNGIPILNAAGIKSTQAIITKYISDSGFMTSSEITIIKPTDQCYISIKPERSNSI